MTAVLAFWLVAPAFQDDPVAADVERYAAAPGDPAAREALLKHGRTALAPLMAAVREGRAEPPDREFLRRLKFDSEKDPANLRTLAKARETRLEVILEEWTLLRVAHAVTSRAAAQDR